MKKTQVLLLHWQQNPITQKLMKTITKKKIIFLVQ